MRCEFVSLDGWCILSINPISFETAIHLIIYRVRDNKQPITAYAHISGVVPTTTGWLV